TCRGPGLSRAAALSRPPGDGRARMGARHHGGEIGAMRGRAPAPRAGSGGTALALRLPRRQPSDLQHPRVLLVFLFLVHLRAGASDVPRLDGPPDGLPRVGRPKDRRPRAGARPVGPLDVEYVTRASVSDASMMRVLSWRTSTFLALGAAVFLAIHPIRS